MGNVFLSISPALGCMCCRTNTLCVGAASGGTAWCSLKVCWGTGFGLGGLDLVDTEDTEGKCAKALTCKPRAECRDSGE